MKFAFDHLDLYRIAAKTYEYNKAAIKLLKKNNFTLEGREREAVSISGERYDRFVYGLLRDEFRD